MTRLALPTAAALGLAAVVPEPAAAHGLVSRSDLPIPEWLFAWGASVVLIVSFVALAVLWPTPRLQRDRWRPLPGRLGRVLGSWVLEALAGAVGVFLLGVVVWAGLSGVDSPSANFAPTFVYVIFWVGLVPVSVLLGDVFRALNPWRAIGRAVSWSVRRVGFNVPAPLPYPQRLGRWPAAAGLLAFAWMELAATGGDSPRNIAIATVVYSAVTFLGMVLYGIDAWIERGEAFSVYFNLFSRISPLERRDGVVGVRPPLTGLTALDYLPGTVAVVAVMIGTVTFDGGAESPLWSDLAPHLQDFFHSLGFNVARALEATFGTGLVAAVILIFVFYWVGVAGARTVGGSLGSREIAGAFVHSLVPIALVYVAAHYLTLLLYQGQAAIYLASDPLGKGWDLFGTADRSIDYGVIGATAAWYWQVGFVVAGHVAGLTLAHDRAIAIYSEARRAVRSQYWMLGVMVGFTTLALWLLSQANR